MVTGLSEARVRHQPRLLSDNGSCYLSGELKTWLKRRDMEHTRGALITHRPRARELLSNVVYSKLTLGGFPAVDCAFINTVDELHAGNHISELPEST